MNKVLSAIICILLFSCSTKYANIIEVKPASPGMTETQFYVYENETVRITYAFWNKYGQMAYTVYNKLSVPIYIDWKKSSLVSNGQKIAYWQDEVRTSSFINGRLYSTAISENSWTGIFNGFYSSQRIKPERITFLTPHSAITRLQNRLFDYSSWQISKPYLKTTLTKVNNLGTMPADYNTYETTRTPLLFRNFLTISTTENFTSESYIDNGFYIANVYRVKTSDFLEIPYYNKETKRTENILTFWNAKWFYIK